MPEEVLTCRALNRATLARQLLLSRATVKPVAALERLGGLQAQLARPPFVALWSRLAGFKREDLVRAVVRRDVVRATLMRGTIHLVSRGDMMAFRPALQPVLSAGMASIFGDRASKLDVSRLVAAARAYFDDEPRTFAELRRHLSAQFPGLDERAMGYMVRMRLPLVQTPVAGERWAYPGQADFAVAESWLGAPFSDDAGGQTLALRSLCRVRSGLRPGFSIVVRSGDRPDAR